MAQGLAALRIFVGSIFLTNGLAKLFGIATITVGPYSVNLIDREATRFILRFEGLENPANAGPGTQVPGLKPVVRFLLDNFDWVQWLITGAETWWVSSWSSAWPPGVQHSSALANRRSSRCSTSLRTGGYSSRRTSTCR